MALLILWKDFADKSPRQGSVFVVDNDEKPADCVAVDWIRRRHPRAFLDGDWHTDQRFAGLIPEWEGQALEWQIVWGGRWDGSVSILVRRCPTEVHSD